MSRIRSVHPGLWTDERFMEVSPLARLLWIGIWTECDDQGSFEWSPVKMKARILPVDNCDVHALLEELVAAGSILTYEIDGRKLGAVRNFTRYQRPKKPNSLYPQTDEIRNYCGGKLGSVPNQFPTDGENPPQMEDGGGRREEEDVDDDARARAAPAAVMDRPWPTDLISLTDEICRVAGIRHVEPGSILAHQKLVTEWLAEGLAAETDIKPGIQAGLLRATEPISSLRFFDRDIRQLRARREAEHGNRDRSNRRAGRAGEIDDAARELGFG